MDEKFDWWGFLKVKEDDWSSGFPSMDLLLKHLRRKSGSISSRRSYCYSVWRLCSDIRATPDELVSKALENPGAVAKSIQEFADAYNNAGSTRYANQIVHIARTFCKVNKVPLELHGYFQPSRSRKRREYIPSLQEALKMADVAGSLRDRLIILLLTYTGLRNSTLRALAYNEAYPDPFLDEYTIKKEMERNEECLIIIVHEVMKQRVPNACKNRIFYYAFVPPEVTACLRLYLHELEQKYGSMSDDQLIFTTQNRKIPLRQRLKTPISPRELQEIVKKIAKRAEIRNWKDVYPHCLRKTNEGFLRNQPDDIRLDNKEREFLFGHTLPGSQDTYFDKTKIEEMRAKYAKMLFEPVASLEREERVVPEVELEGFLKDGWHFEATLPSGRAVVSRKVRAKKHEGINTANGTQVSEVALIEKKPQVIPQLHVSESSTLIDQSARVENSNETSEISSAEKREPNEQQKPSSSGFKEAQSDASRPPSGGSPKIEKAKDKQKHLADFTAGKTGAGS
jgi:integrase